MSDISVLKMVPFLTSQDRLNKFISTLKVQRPLKKYIQLAIFHGHQFNESQY